MLKPSLPDLSKLGQLKTKAKTFLRESNPLSLIVASVAFVAILTTLTLAITYRHAPSSTDPDISQNPNDAPAQGSDSSSAGSSQTPPNQPSSKQPDFIDLQPVVDAWQKTTTANVGLMIYDLDHSRVAASYQPNKVFNVASIYKLFFVYDGYRQIESGAVKADSYYVTTSDYRAGAYTYGECLDLMIRESYNGCANKMRSDKKALARVNNLINEFNLKSTTNAGLSSTAADLTELLRLYYQHPDLSSTSWQKISDSMLNQPATKIDAATTYNWRQGLPSGFSSQTNVYDKVGWAWNADNNIWDTYADAAIVEFPAQNRHYTIVVLTSNLPGRNAAALANLGARIEDAIIAETKFI